MTKFVFHSTRGDEDEAMKMSVPLEVGLVDPTKVGKMSSNVRQLTGQHNTVLSRDDLYTDRLYGSCSKKPSCYEFFPRANHFQLKSSPKSSMLFREVLSLDCILQR